MRKTTAIAASAVALTLTGTLIPTQANAAKVKFGASLDDSVPPAGALPAYPCNWSDLTQPCTFVENEAYGRPGGAGAPVTGTLKKVRLIAGEPGNFTLQLVKTRNVGGVWQSKIKATGPTFHFSGQSAENWSTGIYHRDVFPVNIPIKAGWHLAMKSTTNSVRNCSVGGPITLIHYPALTPGSTFQSAVATEGCYTLLEGVIK